MNYRKLKIPSVIVIEPKVHKDERGFFYESFNENNFLKEVGIKINFVQDNHSFSKKNVLRGLHYQVQNTQGKIIRVTKGKILDIAVDIRKSSETFGQWVGVELSEKNNFQVWIPEGFAHGFYILSDEAEVMYKATNFYSPKDERSILWSDPSIGIDWGLKNVPIISTKDQEGLLLKDAEVFD
tara:strand:+ start:948 stop:1493 length:546 start_codon:yes stop_codon:yes gene_type:complete